MNYPARIFRDLASTWNHDAADERVDMLASELAAHAARTDSSLCLGLIAQDAVPKYYGLVYLLDTYGLVLRKRYRQNGDAVFVYLETKQAAHPHEYAGAVVNELASPEVHPVLTIKALPRAA